MDYSKCSENAVNLSIKTTSSKSVKLDIEINKRQPVEKEEGC